MPEEHWIERTRLSLGSLSPILPLSSASLQLSPESMGRMFRDVSRTPLILPEYTEQHAGLSFWSFLLSVSRCIERQGIPTCRDESELSSALVS